MELITELLVELVPFFVLLSLLATVPSVATVGDISNVPIFSSFAGGGDDDDDDSAIVSFGDLTATDDDDAGTTCTASRCCFVSSISSSDDEEDELDKDIDGDNC